MPDFVSTVWEPLGNVHKLREAGGGMGDLRGDLKILYTERGGGPEMLPEH